MLSGKFGLARPGANFKRESRFFHC
jgi:hypothetical protein